MRSRNNYLFILLAVLLVVALLLRNIFSISKYHNRYSPKTELNRNELIVLSRHAKCRMDCRHITEDEIKEILRDGEINYNKSDPGNTRGPVYALEGFTHEHQHLRVVFADNNNDHNNLVVVTCIDLEKDWPCDCP